MAKPTKAAKTEFATPMRTASGVYKIVGVDDKAIKDFFGKKKVTATKGPTGWTLAYKARGASRQDIERRLETLVTKSEGKASYELLEKIPTVNHEAKPKAKASK